MLDDPSSVGVGMENCGVFFFFFFANALLYASTTTTAEASSCLSVSLSRSYELNNSETL